SHSRRASVPTPSLLAIDVIAAHSDGYSSRCSCTIRTARSRSSCGYLLRLPIGSILSKNRSLHQSQGNARALQRPFHVNSCTAGVLWRQPPALTCASQSPTSESPPSASWRTSIACLTPPPLELTCVDRRRWLLALAFCLGWIWLFDIHSAMQARQRQQSVRAS